MDVDGALEDTCSIEREWSIGNQSFFMNTIFMRFTLDQSSDKGLQNSAGTDFT